VATSAKMALVLPHPEMFLSDHVVASAKCSRRSLFGGAESAVGS
jgi:hypothetical protein